MASPWAKIQPITDTLSFEEITAEEIVKNMQRKELERCINQVENTSKGDIASEVNNTNNDEAIAQLLQQFNEEDYRKSVKPDDNTKSDISQENTTLCSGEDTSNDVAIAQMLQYQYCRDYDLMLKRTEEKVNGKSKVGISLSNFRTGCSLDEPENSQKANNDKEPDLDRFVSIEKEYASIPRCGYKKNAEGSGIVTKHDVLMSSRINACRVLEFPPGISTGDTGGFDVKLNNKVFNSLRVHSHAYCARQKAKTRPNNNNNNNNNK